MEGLIPLIVQLLSGAAGGNIIGKLLPKLNLGTLGNSLSGIIGGGLGGSLLGMLGMAAEPSGGLDLSSILGSVGSGAAGGGVLMFIVGLVKKLLVK